MSTDFYIRVQDVLYECDLESKLNKTHALYRDFIENKLKHYSMDDISEVLSPGRPEVPKLVSPRDVPRRRLGSEKGIIAMVHAVLHIEFNAINLALDAVYRFRGMPETYYKDWLKVADEEAYHFSLLAKCLSDRDVPAKYGDLVAHDGLWDAARNTAHDPLIRMAMVPRVLEARGLDVSPKLIEKLEALKETDIVDALRVILKEEEGHVLIGNRWFQYLCKEKNLDPKDTFFKLLEEYGYAPLPGPFNLTARANAGFSQEELDKLMQDAPYQPDISG